MDEVAVLTRVGRDAGRAAGEVVRALRRGTVSLAASGATAGWAGVSTLRRSATVAARGALHRAATIRSGPPAVTLAPVDTVRQQLAERIAPRRRARWPWALAVVAAVGALVGVLAWRRPVAPPPAAGPPRVTDHGVRDATTEESSALDEDGPGEDDAVRDRLS